MSLLLLTQLAMAQPAEAVAVPITDPPMCDPVAPQDLDKATDDLGRELACPVCSGQSVAGSTVPVALGMKAIIHSGLSQGYCPEQISDYFVSVYGDDVVLDPSKRGDSALIWLPLLGVLVGFVGAGVWWMRQPKVPLEASEPAGGAADTQATAAEDPYQAQVLRELDE